MSQIISLQEEIRAALATAGELNQRAVRQAVHRAAMPVAEALAELIAAGTVVRAPGRKPGEHLYRLTGGRITEVDHEKKEITIEGPVWMARQETTVDNVSGLPSKPGCSRWVDGSRCPNEALPDASFCQPCKDAVDALLKRRARR